MGGEREDVIKTRSKMIGTVGELRFHESNGHIHFHDDVNKLKCAVPVAVWWREWDRVSGPVRKLATEFFVYADFGNKSFLRVEVSISKGNIGSNVLLKPMVNVSDTFTKLNKFTRHKG